MSNDVESAEAFTENWYAHRLIRAAERERIAKHFDDYRTATISRNNVARVIRAMGDEKL